MVLPAVKATTVDEAQRLHARGMADEQLRDELRRVSGIAVQPSVAARWVAVLRAEQASRARPDYDPRIDHPERYQDTPILRRR